MSNFYCMFMDGPNVNGDDRDAEEISSEIIAAFQRSHRISELVSNLCRYLPKGVADGLVRYYQERCSCSDKLAIPKLAMKILIACRDMRHFQASSHPILAQRKPAPPDDEPLTAAKAIKKALDWFLLSEKEENCILWEGVLEPAEVAPIRPKPGGRNATKGIRPSVEKHDKAANRTFALPKLGIGAAESKAIVDDYRRRQENGECRTDDKLFADLRKVLPEHTAQDVFERFLARRARSDPKALSTLEMELVLALSDSQSSAGQGK